MLINLNFDKAHIISFNQFEVSQYLKTTLTT